MEKYSFEKQNKWKIGVSLSTGCDVGCIYCFTRNLDFYRPLSVEEIVEQASFVYDQNNFSDKQIDEVKIEMKEMGDPALNVDGVCGAIRILNDKFLNLLYVVSSSGVKNYSLFELLSFITCSILLIICLAAEYPESNCNAFLKYSRAVSRSFLKTYPLPIL